MPIFTRRTLGLNFLWRGLIQIVRQGNRAPLTFLTKTDLYQILVGRVGFVPVQLIWGLLFAVLGILLFTRFRFGSQVACIGDNIEAARKMGINVRLIKTLTFAFVGLASGLAGVLAVLINNNFWPTVGDGYLLSVLAAVFAMRLWPHSLMPSGCVTVCFPTSTARLLKRPKPVNRSCAPWLWSIRMIRLWRHWTSSICSVRTCS